MGKRIRTMLVISATVAMVSVSGVVSADDGLPIDPPDPWFCYTHTGWPTGFRICVPPD